VETYTCYRMCMMTRRLQILLDEERYRRVADSAAKRKVSVATVIRDAIDRGLAEPANAKADAARRLLAADLVPAPSVEELRAELDDLRGRYA